MTDMTKDEALKWLRRGVEMLKRHEALLEKEGVLDLPGCLEDCLEALSRPAPQAGHDPDPARVDVRSYSLPRPAAAPGSAEVEELVCSLRQHKDTMHYRAADLIRRQSEEIAKLTVSDREIAARIEAMRQRVEAEYAAERDRQAQELEQLTEAILGASGENIDSRPR